MASSQDIIDRATGILRVRGAGVSFSSNAKNSDLFAALQDLIAEWVEDAVLNIPAPALVTDTLDIPPGTQRALAFNLACEIASDMGKQPTQMTTIIASESRDRLEAEISIDMSVDLSDLAFSNPYNIETDR